MLETIRKYSSSIVVKFLFGLLILSFGIWGVGDVVRGRFSGDWVVRVGAVDITPDELNREFQREINRLAPLFGGRLDREQARGMGLLDGVLRDVIDRTLFRLEAQDLGLVVGDPQVRAEIRNNPTFQDGAGRFSRLLFDQVLRANALTEDGFVRLVRADIINAQLIESVQGTGIPPATLVNAIYRLRQERRVADVLIAADEKMPDPGAPDEPTLVAYHAENAAQFTAPEVRALTYVAVLADDLALEIEVGEDRLRDAYEGRRAEYAQPEQRHLQQMLFADQATARRAETELTAGRPFAEVAKEVAGMDPAAVDLGLVRQDGMLPELADSVFGLPAGAHSAPLASPLGWHIVRVEAIEPARERSFAEVRDELARAVAKEAATDGVYSLSRKLEDALAGGATLEEAARRLNLRLDKMPAVDATGRDPKGDAVEGLPGASQILSTAFQLPEGRESALVEIGADGYVVLRVDKVTPATLRSLAEVRAEVVAAWKAERRAAAAGKLAGTALERLQAGADPAGVARELGLTLVTPPPLLRTATTAETPQALVGAVFGLKPGDAAAVRAADGHYVARLKEIRPADPTADKDGVEALRRLLAQRLRADLVAQYAAALQKRYSVSVDSRAVERLF